MYDETYFIDMNFMVSYIAYNIV